MNNVKTKNRQRSLLQFLQRHRKFFTLSALVLIGVMIVPQFASAQASSASTFDEVGNSLLKGVSYLMRLFQVMLWPILLMIGSLLQNDILFSPGMEEKLLVVWGLVRNMVNVIMVLALVAVAFFNIVGGGGLKEEYSVKTYLPKFIIALIAVNFLYFGVKVVLDFVSIVSTGIFAIPNSVEQNLAPTNSNNPGDKKVGILTVKQINDFCHALYGREKAEYEKSLNAAKGNSFCVLEDDTTHQYQGTLLNSSNTSVASFFNTFNARNAGVVMAIELLNINTLDTVNVKDPTVANLTIAGLTAVVLYVIYAAAFVALFVVLLVRVASLWLMIAVSPFMVLKYVIPAELMPGVGDDIVQKFIKNAIIPIPVAMIMSIGFILLEAFKKSSVQNNPNLNVLLNSPTLGLNLFTSGITTLQDLIIALGTIAFVWVGVFEAMRGTFAEEGVNTIKGWVQGAGSFVAQLPMLAPIFPTATGEKISLGAISQLSHRMKALPEEKQRAEAERAFPGIMGHEGKNAENLKNAKNWGEASKTLSTMDINNTDNKKAFGEYLKRNRAEQTRIRPWIPAKYHGNVQKFMEDLEKGNVSEAEMNEFFHNAKITNTHSNAGASAGATPTSPASHGFTDKQNEARNKWKRRKPGEKLYDDAGLTPDEQRALTDASNATDMANLNPQTKQAFESAMKKIEASETKAAAIAAAVSTFQTQMSTTLLNDMKNNATSPAEYQKFEASMQTQFDKMVAAGVDSNEAAIKLQEVVSKTVASDQATKDKWVNWAKSNGKTEANSPFLMALNYTPPAAPAAPAGGTPPARP